ncbi:hypothetical protein M0P48_03225 [Candidatus Gracilibacteria bacterium]|nr:hypothetical protein [Candidatus Gracilibacteria bacterium]
MPQDEKNMQAIQARITGGELTTPEAISEAVDLLAFSSEEVKDHARDSMLTLFEAGAYKSPIKGVNMSAIDVDKAA